MKNKKKLFIVMALLLASATLANSAHADRAQLYVGYKLPENTDLVYEARRLEANAISQRNIEIQACANGNNAVQCEEQAEIAFRRRISAIPGSRFILNYKINRNENMTSWVMNLSASEAIDFYLNQEFTHLQPEYVYPLGVDIETYNCELLRTNTNTPISYHKEDFQRLVCQMIQENKNTSLQLWKMVFNESTLPDNQLSDAAFFLEHGANANIKNTSDVSILMMASINNHVHLGKLLINYGADVNAKDNGGTMPLGWAANVGNLDMVKLLVENGASINARQETERGFTALLNAASGGHLEVVQYLLQMGVPVNQRSHWGQTALYLAVAKNYTELAEFLRANGGVE